MASLRIQHFFRAVLKSAGAEEANVLRRWLLFIVSCGMDLHRLFAGLTPDIPTRIVRPDWEKKKRFNRSNRGCYKMYYVEVNAGSTSDHHPCNELC